MFTINSKILPAAIPLLLSVVDCPLVTISFKETQKASSEPQQQIISIQQQPQSKQPRLGITLIACVVIVCALVVGFRQPCSKYRPARPVRQETNTNNHSHTCSPSDVSDEKHVSYCDPPSPPSDSSTLCDPQQKPSSSLGYWTFLVLGALLLLLIDHCPEALVQRFLDLFSRSKVRQFERPPPQAGLATRFPALQRNRLALHSQVDTSIASKCVPVMGALAFIEVVRDGLGKMQRSEEVNFRSCRSRCSSWLIESWIQENLFCI